MYCLVCRLLSMSADILHPSHGVLGHLMSWCLVTRQKFKGMQDGSLTFHNDHHQQQVLSMASDIYICMTASTSVQHRCSHNDLQCLNNPDVTCQLAVVCKYRVQMFFIHIFIFILSLCFLCNYLHIYAI